MMEIPVRMHQTRTRPLRGESPPGFKCQTQSTSAYRYPVKIENGAVGYAGSASFNISGSVGNNGAVTVTVSRGSQSATGTGRMSATDGGGTWTAGSGECSGTWSAERRS
jgi:hypothetical protein